jgi:DNA-binding LacI/PurR family transcriptional regulator
MSTPNSKSALQQRNSLHGKIREQLRAEYLEPAGSALPSLRELSRQLGVNHATISRALRDLEKEGMVEVVPRKGVFSLSTPAPRADDGAAISIELAVFASENQSVLDVATALSKGIMQASEAREKSSPRLQVARTILNVPPLPDPQVFVSGLRKRDVGAVAFLGFGYLNFPDSHRETDFLFQVSQQMPTVLIGGPHPSLELDCVFSDPRPQLIAFLKKCHADGLRAFEFLGMRRSLPHQQLRYEEFCHFIMQRGLSWPGNDYDDLSTPDLATRLKSLKKLPEAVIAVNINRALTFILEAQRRGLQLPHDARVLCFASSAAQAAPIMPYADVVLLDEATVGECAMEMLLERQQQKVALVSSSSGTTKTASPRRELIPAQLFTAGSAPRS